MNLFQRILPAALLLMGIVAQAQTTIHLKGQVVGNVDSCMVALVDEENPQDSKRLASAKFVGESFSLSAPLGKVPRLARLSFFTRNSNGKWLHSTELHLFLDGSPVSVRIDRDLMATEMKWQKKQALVNQPDGKIIVEAGKAQTSYADYLAFVKASSVTADSASYAEANAWFDHNGDDDAIKDYKERHEAAKAAFEAKHNEYIRLNPNAPISAALVAQYAYAPFSYDLDLFEKQYASLASNPDTMHVNFIKRNLDYFRSHANGANYTDFAAENKDGKSVLLSSLMKPGKMMLIDFWASWCGPCRSAIPKVKQMAKDFADKLEVVSCSVDEKKDAWLKAEKEEAMPWAQLFLPLSKLEKAAKAYSISSIPRLVLIGADGKVLCITYSPEVIKRFLQ